MKKRQVKRNLVLGILFLLPVVFLLFLYPSKHNYNPLDIVNPKVSELNGFSSDSNEPVELKDHITVLGFLGTDPLGHILVASNVKALVYDKFKGFKHFQIVFVAPQGTQEAVQKLEKEINRYEEVKYWHYVFGQPEDIQNLYKTLKSNSDLNSDLSIEDVFIIDKDLSQRGRLDDRNKKEIKTNGPEYPLYAYNCIDIGVIRNKMSDDMRVLFTEYRQKRKGNFDSEQRRVNDIGTNDEQKN